LLFFSQNEKNSGEKKGLFILDQISGQHDLVTRLDALF